MNILFCVWSSYPPKEIFSDPSVWYRCFQPASSLRHYGCKASVIHNSEFNFSEKAFYDAIIFFRPIADDNFYRIIEYTEKNNITTISSYDDIFFDIKFLRQSSFRGLQVPQSHILSNRPQPYARAFYFFENYISSTDVMSDVILSKDKSKNVYTHYNGVCPEIYHYSRFIISHSKKTKGRVGYFPGGSSHTIDIRRISSSLKSILERGDATFFCTNTVNIPQEIMDTQKVELVDRMNYFDMMLAYSTCHVTIAPLERSVFTDSKSGIKYLESAINGSYVVATPIPDIVRVSGEMSILVNEDSDWENCILDALSRKTLDNTEVIEVQNKIYEKNSTIKLGKNLCEFIQKCISKGNV